jgi:nicotinamidase-related amidase
MSGKSTPSTSGKDYKMSGQFTPENGALVLIDHQVGTLQFVYTMSPDESLRNAVMLAKAAKAYGMPVVLTTSQEDHMQGPTAPALQQALPEAYNHRVKRAGIVNAWADPNFSAAVSATGRKKLIMAAVTTDICLIFPAISAVQEGFDVLAVLDASGSSYKVQESLARERMERAGVVLTTTNTAIASVYKQQCSSCHGLPGQPAVDYATTMFPKPPQLFHGKGVTDDPASETYWKAANGIRLSGMPSFKTKLSDTQLWQVSQLLAHANEIPESVKRSLVPDSPTSASVPAQAAASP